MSWFFLLHVAPAILPPVDPSERDYYSILGVSSRKTGNNRNSKSEVTTEQIRKAFKRKSLELHPDKIAQRGGGQEAAAQAAAEYSQVQEAYAVLVDPKQRQLYERVNRSNVRYKFVAGLIGSVEATSGNSPSHNSPTTHPMEIFENLQKASCVDKSRLVLALGIVFSILLLQPVLMAAKINAVVENDKDAPLFDISWFIIFLPFWILYGAMILFNLFSLPMVFSSSDQEFSPYMKAILVATLFQEICFLTGMVLLVQNWELIDSNSDDSDQRNWHFVSIPFYLAIVLRIYRASKWKQSWQHEQDKMVSPEKYETLLQERMERNDVIVGGTVEMPEQGATTDGATQDESNTDPHERAVAELAEEYTVVTIQQELVDVAIEALKHEQQLARENGNNNNSIETGIDGISPEEEEEIKVQTSLEFEAIQSIIDKTNDDIRSLAFIAVPFVALVASKLEGPLDHNLSWWIVFLPLFISQGRHWFQSLFDCCCAGSTSPTLSAADLVAMSNAAAEAQQQQQQQQQEEGTGVSAASPSQQQQGQRDQTETGGSVVALQQQQQEQNPTETTLPSSASSVSPSTTNQTQKQELLSSNGEQQTTSSGINKDAAPSRSGETEEEEGDTINIDPEAFSAWAQAQEHLNKEAAEKQRFGFLACLISSFNIGMICMIVAKLEKDYDPDDEDDNDDTGMNTFWILFPFLLLSGLLYCCCCCAIYGAGSAREELSGAYAQGDELNEDNDRGNNNSNNNSVTGTGVAAAATTAPSPTTSASPDQLNDALVTSDPASGNANEEPTSAKPEDTSMSDLD